MLRVKTQSVREFLRALLPTEAHFPANRWLFRGQADARWGLTPSILRASSWESIGGAQRFGFEVRDGTVGPPERVEGVEHALLDVLGKVIDRLGLDQSLREPDALMAFAQHIGLPTRLLDWTNAPFAAAYFAASSAVRFADTGGTMLAVYAISTIYLLRHPAEVATIERLSVPGAGNRNLVAQSGEFLKFLHTRDLLENVQWIDIPPGLPLERPMASVVDNHLVAITLPVASAPELLVALRDQGVHAGTLFPGDYGVAQLVREVFLHPQAEMLSPPSGEHEERGTEGSG